MSTDESEDELMDSPSEIITNAIENRLPLKSQAKYEHNYNKFMEWKLLNAATSFSEDVILAYFEELSKNIMPTTLWANYSMLKTSLYGKHNIDLSKYYKVRAYLKRKSSDFKTKRLNSLSSNQINEFIKTAPDDKYLFVKVGLIFGIMGSCRREELQKIKRQDIEDFGSVLLVKINCIKSSRSFIITGNYYKICKKYMNLRPPFMDDSDRFFVNYQKGKCTQQFVGINKLGSLPKEIAKYLKLPNPESYTGRCFRRSSANILGDTVDDLITPEIHGRWKTNTVAEGCVDNFLMPEGENNVLNTLETPSTSKSLPEILPKVKKVLTINKFHNALGEENVEELSNVGEKYQIIREMPKIDLDTKIVNKNEKILLQAKANTRTSLTNPPVMHDITQMKQGNQQFKKRRIIDLIFFLEQIKNLASHNESNNCNFKHLTPTTEIYNGLQSKIVFKCDNCHKLFPIDTDKNELNDSLVSVAETTYLQYKGLKKFCDVIDLPVMSEIQYKNIKTDFEQNDVNDLNTNNGNVNSSSVLAENSNDSYNFEGNINDNYNFLENSNHNYDQENSNSIKLKSLLKPSTSKISLKKTARNNKVKKKTQNNEKVNDNRNEIKIDENVSRNKRKCDDILINELIIKKEIDDEDNTDYHHEDDNDYHNEYESNIDIFGDKRKRWKESDRNSEQNIGTNELTNQQSSKLSTCNKNELVNNEQLVVSFIKEEINLEEIIIKEEKFDT